ncbi:MAG: sodium:calcium antiporter [Bacteroidales bacterium]|nr:sodium:calcium antiporter [Bacteroidales bacterium]
MAEALKIVYPIVVILVSGFIIWRSTNAFELASDYLGRNLSKGIKGATINAISSSMPEFLSTMFFLFYVRDPEHSGSGFSGGIGITGGSAIFNILIIPLCVYFAASATLKVKTIPVERKTLLRDGSFLILMTILVAVVLHDDVLKPIHGLLLTTPYFIYITFLFYTHKRTPVSDNSFKYSPLISKSVISDLLMINVERFVLKGRMIRTLTAWKLLLASTMVMMLGTWLLVYGTEMLGSRLNIPLVFVSVVLASAASSIPDTMISIRDARKGNYEDSLSNALGSNIFDISFALGVPLLLYTFLFNQTVQLNVEEKAASTDIWFILAIITLVTVLLLLSGKSITRFKVLILALLYLIFVSFIVLELIYSIDVTGSIYSFVFRTNLPIP